MKSKEAVLDEALQTVHLAYRLYKSCTEEAKQEYKSIWLRSRREYVEKYELWKGPTMHRWSKINNVERRLGRLLFQTEERWTEEFARPNGYMDMQALMIRTKVFALSNRHSRVSIKKQRISQKLKKHFEQHREIERMD